MINDSLAAGWFVDSSYGEIPPRKELETTPGLVKNAKVFYICLGFTVLLGLAVRIVYVATSRWDQGLPAGDYFYYYNFAINFASGHFPVVPGTNVVTASHPPLWPIVLAIGDRFGLGSVHDQSIINCVLGALAVGVIGLVGRKLGGATTGIAAAVIASIYPGLWVYDGTSLAEPTEVLCFCLILLLAYRYFEKPSRYRAIAIGAMIGVIVLARSEQISLLILLLAPLIFLRRNIRWKERFIQFAAGCIAAVCVFSFWSIHVFLSFKNPEFFSTQSGITLETANCYATWNGPFTGYWNIGCATDLVPSGDESQADSYYRSLAIKYVENNTSRLPYVLLAREGRMWNFWQPFQQANLDQTEGWTHYGALGDIWSYWTLWPFVVVGFIVLRKRKIPISPLFAAILLTVMVAALIYGNQRYRASTEVVWVLCGAVGLLQAVTWLSKSKKT